MEEEFDNEEYLNSLPPSVREDLESGSEGAWTVGPAEAAAGLMIAPGLVTKAAKTWGAGKVLETGLNIIAPDAEDTLLEQALESRPALKTGVKGTRLLYENILKDVFDHRILDRPSSITRFSTLQKHKHNKDILDQYVHKKAVEGPHKNWQDQGIPQTELSSEISDLARKNDLQLSQPSFGQNFVPPNPTEIHKVTQKLLNEHLLANGGRFNWNAFRSLLESPKARSIAELVQTTPHSKIPNWDTHRKGLVDVFESIYGDTMALKGISRSDIDIDHLVTLVQSMPIYDNVKFGSPLWNEIQTAMLARNYKPGRTLENLNALDPGTHKVKTAFFNNLHGKDGRGFFTKARMKAIQNDPDARMKLLDLYLDEVDKGTAILEEGQKVWESLYKPGTVLPEQLVETLSNIEINKYSHPDLIKITKDIVESESERILKNISIAEQNLINKINNPNQKTRVTKKNRLPTEKQIDQQIKEAGDSFQPTMPELLDYLFKDE